MTRFSIRINYRFRDRRDLRDRGTPLTAEGSMSSWHVNSSVSITQEGSRKPY